MNSGLGLQQGVGLAATGIGLGIGLLGMSIPLIVMKRVADEMGETTQKPRAKKTKKGVDLGLPVIKIPSVAQQRAVKTSSYGYEMPKIRMPDININIPTMKGTKRIKY